MTMCTRPHKNIVDLSRFVSGSNAETQKFLILLNWIEKYNIFYEIKCLFYFPCLPNFSMYTALWFVLHNDQAPHKTWLRFSINCPTSRYWAWQAPTLVHECIISHKTQNNSPDTEKDYSSCSVRMNIKLNFQNRYAHYFSLSTKMYPCIYLFFKETHSGELHAVQWFSQQSLRKKK